MTEALLAQKLQPPEKYGTDCTETKMGKSRHRNGQKKGNFGGGGGWEVKGDGVTKQRIKQNSIKEKKKNTEQQKEHRIKQTNTKPKDHHHT